MYVRVCARACICCICLLVSVFLVCVAVKCARRGNRLMFASAPPRLNDNVSVTSFGSTVDVTSTLVESVATVTSEEAKRNFVGSAGRVDQDPDETNWDQLSYAQLQRAGEERAFAAVGSNSDKIGRNLTIWRLLARV